MLTFIKLYNRSSGDISINHNQRRILELLEAIRPEHVKPELRDHTTQKTVCRFARLSPEKPPVGKLPPPSLKRLPLSLFLIILSQAPQGRLPSSVVSSWRPADGGRLVAPCARQVKLVVQDKSSWLFKTICARQVVKMVL